MITACETDVHKYYDISLMSRIYNTCCTLRHSIRKLLKTFYGCFLSGTVKDKTAFFVVVILEKAVF
jgi:hypothetical protein